MPLELPPTFAFSQSSLQSFANCPRRFWLAYVEQLSWPAIEAAPYDEHEELMKLGAQFHQLVERAEAGLSTDLLTEGLDHPLDGWFESYLRHRPADLPESVEVERVLSVPFATATGQYRLAARYDLLAVGGEDAQAARGDPRLEDQPAADPTLIFTATLADDRLSVCAGGGERGLALGTGNAGAG